MTTIGDSAFSRCDSLKSIDLPDSVTTIGGGAFSGCSLLTSVEVSEKSENYISVDGVLFTKDRKTFVQYPAGKKDKEYAIPSGVTTIGGYAFSGCSSLESIDLPDGVTTIGDRAFSECSSLESIDLPDSVTTIGNWAFSRCRSLKSIDLPDSVTTIGDCAFSECSSLESIDLPDSVTTIADEAFDGCPSLTIRAPKGSFAEEYAKEKKSNLKPPNRRERFARRKTRTF